MQWLDKGGSFTSRYVPSLQTGEYTEFFSVVFVTWVELCSMQLGSLIIQVALYHLVIPVPPYRLKWSSPLPFSLSVKCSYFLCKIQTIGVILPSVVFPPFSQALGDFFELFLGGSINVEDRLTRFTIKPAGYLIQMWLLIYKKITEFGLALYYMVQVQGNYFFKRLVCILFFVLFPLLDTSPFYCTGLWSWVTFYWREIGGILFIFFLNEFDL